MSGASGIAAAKNRRGKETFSRFPQNNQTCAAKGGGCPRPGSAPPQNISRTSQGQTQSQAQAAQQYSPFLENKMVDPVTLRVTGPMQPLQIIQIHEQRLNKFDVRFEELRMAATATALCTPALCTPALCTPAPSAFSAEVPSIENCISECSQECANRINDLEDKVNVLEEVILNLQLTLANVQNFAMETNMALMKLNNSPAPAQAQAPVTPSLPILVESTFPSELTTPLNLLEIESITMEITENA